MINEKEISSGLNVVYNRHDQSKSEDQCYGRVPKEGEGKNGNVNGKKGFGLTMKKSTSQRNLKTRIKKNTRTRKGE